MGPPYNYSGVIDARLIIAVSICISVSVSIRVGVRIAIIAPTTTP
jgi:hypothetical protein